MFTYISKPIRSIILIVCVVLMAAACRKEKETTPSAVDGVTIDIMSPTNNDILNAGDTMHIHAIVKSPVSLHGYSWRLINQTNGDILTEKSDHSHGKELTIHDPWPLEFALSQPIQAQLSISVILNHDGKTANKNVNLTLNP